MYSNSLPMQSEALANPCARPSPHQSPRDRDSRAIARLSNATQLNAAEKTMKKKRPAQPVPRGSPPARAFAPSLSINHLRQSQGPVYT